MDQNSLDLARYDAAWAHDLTLFTNKLLANNPAMSRDFAQAIVAGELRAQLYANLYTEVVMMWGREAGDKYTRMVYLGDSENYRWLIEASDILHRQEERRHSECQK